MRRSRLQYTKPTPRPRLREERGEKRSYVPYGRDIDRGARDKTEQDRTSFFCDVCKQQMSSKVVYDLHCDSAFHIEKTSKLAKATVDSVWKCHTCEKTFAIKLALDQHCLLFRHQPLYRIEGVPKAEVAENPREQSQLRKVFSFGPLMPPNYCDVCKVDCLSPSNLRIHLESWRHRAAVDKEKEGEKSAVIDKKTDEGAAEITKEPTRGKDSPVEDKSEQLEKSFACEVCTIYVNSRAAYVDHVIGKKHKRKVANMKPPYCCKPCDKRYASERDFNAHFESNKHLEKIGLGMSKISKDNLERALRYQDAERESRERSRESSRYRGRSRSREGRRGNRDGGHRRQRSRDRSDSRGRDRRKRDSKERTAGRGKEKKEKRYRKGSSDRSTSSSRSDVEIKADDEEQKKKSPGKDANKKESIKKKAMTDKKTKVIEAEKEESVKEDDEDRQIQIKEADETVLDLREKLNKGKNIVITKKVKDEKGFDIINTEERTVSEENLPISYKDEQEDGSSLNGELAKIRLKSDLLMREQLLKEHNIEILRYKDSEEEYKRLCLEESFLKRRLSMFRDNDPRRENDLSDLIRVERAIREVREELAVRDMMIQEKERYLIVLKNRLEGQLPDASQNVSTADSLEEDKKEEFASKMQKPIDADSRVVSGEHDEQLKLGSSVESQHAEPEVTTDLRSQIEKERLIKKIGPEINDLDPALRQRILQALYLAESANTSQSIGGEQGSYIQDHQALDLREQLDHFRENDERPMLQTKEEGLRKTLIDLIQQEMPKQMQKNTHPDAAAGKYTHSSQSKSTLPAVHPKKQKTKEHQTESSSYDSDDDDKSSKKKKNSNGKKKSSKEKTEKRKKSKSIKTDASPDSHRDSSKKKTSASPSSKSVPKKRHRSRSASSSPDGKKMKKTKSKKKDIEADRKKKQVSGSDKSGADVKKPTKASSNVSPSFDSNAKDDRKLQKITVVSKKRQYITGLNMYDDENEEGIIAPSISDAVPDRTPVIKQLSRSPTENVVTSQQNRRPREQFAFWKSTNTPEEDSREDIWETALGPGPRTASDAMAVDIFANSDEDASDYRKGKLHVLQRTGKEIERRKDGSQVENPVYPPKYLSSGGAAEARFRSLEGAARYMMDPTNQASLMSQQALAESSNITETQVDPSNEKPRVKRGILKKPSEKFVEKDKELLKKVAGKSEHEGKEETIPGIRTREETPTSSRAVDREKEHRPVKEDAEQPVDAPQEKETAARDPTQAEVGITSKDLEKISFILESFKKQYGSEWDSSQIECDLKKVLEKQHLKHAEKSSEKPVSQWEREEIIPGIGQSPKEISSVNYREPMRSEANVERGITVYDYSSKDDASPRLLSSSQTNPLFPIKIPAASSASQKQPVIENLSVRRVDQEIPGFSAQQPPDVRQDRYHVRRSPVEQIYQKPIASDDSFDRYKATEQRMMGYSTRQNIPQTIGRAEEKEPMYPRFLKNPDLEPAFESIDKRQYQGEEGKFVTGSPQTVGRAQVIQSNREFRPIAGVDDLQEREKAGMHRGEPIKSYSGSQGDQRSSLEAVSVKNRDTRMFEDNASLPHWRERRGLQENFGDNPSVRGSPYESRASWDNRSRESLRMDIGPTINERRGPVYRENDREHQLQDRPEPGRAFHDRRMEQWEQGGKYRSDDRGMTAARFAPEKPSSKERGNQVWEDQQRSDWTSQETWKTHERAWNEDSYGSSSSHVYKAPSSTEHDHHMDAAAIKPSSRPDSIDDTSRDEMRFQSRERRSAEISDQERPSSSIEDRNKGDANQFSYIFKTLNEDVGRGMFHCTLCNTFMETETDRTIHAHSQHHMEAAATKDRDSSSRPLQRMPMTGIRGNGRPASSIAPDDRFVSVNRNAHLPTPGTVQRGARPSRPYDNRGRGNFRPRGNFNPRYSGPYEY